METLLLSQYGYDTFHYENNIEVNRKHRPDNVARLQMTKHRSQLLKSVVNQTSFIWDQLLRAILGATAERQHAKVLAD